MHALISRGVAPFLALTFLGTIALGVLVDVVAIRREPTDPRERIAVQRLREVGGPTAASLVDGTWAKALQGKMPEASWLAARTRPFYTDVAVGLFGKTPPDVVLGKSDWLFYMPTLVPTESSPFSELVQAVAIARARGIPVTVLFVPSKAAIYPEFLRRPVHPERAAVYGRLLALCRDNGVATLDLRAPLIAAKDDGKELLYHPNDTHVTTRGTLVLARAIAERVYGTDPADGEELSRSMMAARRPPAPFPGDLHVMLDLPRSSSVNERFFVPSARPPSLDFPLDDDAAHVWVGDSFSRYHDQFLPKVTATLLSWPSVSLVPYRVGWLPPLLARLGRTPAPKSLTIVLAARWFHLP